MNGFREHDPDGADEPIIELATFTEPVAAGFGQRLRGRIQRRLFAGDVTRLTWYAPVVVFMEFVGILLTFVGAAPEDETETRDND